MPIYGRIRKAISLHAYPNNHYSDYVKNAYENNLATYRSIAVGKDVWITETGQHSAPDREYSIINKNNQTA